MPASLFGRFTDRMIDVCVLFGVTLVEGEQHNA